MYAYSNVDVCMFYLNKLQINCTNLCACNVFFYLIIFLTYFSYKGINVCFYCFVIVDKMQ